MSTKTDLILYADDFRKYGDWISICYILGVNPEYTKVTLTVTNVVPDMNEDLTDFEE